MMPKVPKNLSVVLHAGPGLDYYTFQLANSLSAIARVAYSVDAKQMERFGSAIDRRVTLLPFNRPRRRQLWGFQEMYRLSCDIRNFNLDVFHLQGDGLWESVLFRLLRETLRINTVHDPIKHIDQRTLLNNALMYDVIRQSKGWVVHSDGLKTILLDRFLLSPDRVLVHHHGVDTYYSSFPTKKTLREKTILFFGNLRINKGADILLRAFYLIRDQISDWKIIIAGGGKGLEGKEDLIEQLDGQLIFLNHFIDDNAVGDLFSRSGIVALPYRHGSQSGVLAIAGAFGCPVLATTVGNMPEIMQDGKHVLFAEPDNIESFAKKLLVLAQDSELRVKIGEGLRTLANKEWSWDVIALKTIGFYERLLSQ